MLGRQWRHGRDQLRHLQGVSLYLIIFHQIAHQPRNPSLFSGDRLPGQGHAHGLGLAHRPHQALSAANARHDADANLGLAKPGAASGHDNVGQHRQLAPAAIGITTDRRNHRLGAMLDRRPDPLGMALVNIDRADPGHAVDIPSGGKHLVTTGQHNAAHFRVDRQLSEVARQQRLQFKAQGVGGLGPVEAQQGHARSREFKQYRRGRWV